MLGAHAIGYTIISLALFASIAIPLFLARKRGRRIAFSAVAIWALVWIVILKGGDLSYSDAVATSLIPTAWWLLGACIGLALRSRRGSGAARLSV
jgi:hypothetical protein